MKKFLFLAFALLALNFSFTSCSDDDDVNAPDSLVGTSWKAEVVLEGETFSTIITFDSPSTVLFQYNDDEDDDEIAYYTYSKPTVTITMEGDEPRTGTVNGNKITFTEAGVSVVFIRQ
jgi:hypothetical protein